MSGGVLYSGHRVSVAFRPDQWAIGFRLPRPEWESFALYIGPIVIQRWVGRGRAVVTISATGKPR